MILGFPSMTKPVTRCALNTFIFLLAATNVVITAVRGHFYRHRGFAVVLLFCDAAHLSWLPMCQVFFCVPRGMILLYSLSYHRYVEAMCVFEVTAVRGR